MTPLIRLAEPSDVPAMASIRAQEWQTQEFWMERIDLYLRGAHSPRQALSARASFVALFDDEVVGFVSGHRTRRFGCDGELQWINVAEQKRGLGIAGKLLKAIAAWFTSQGALRICVNVDPNNTAARKLYAKYGARPLNEHWVVWDDPRHMVEHLN